MFKVNREERGSILPMTVILMAVVLTFAAFAVDLGVKRVARSDMQAVASVVALDMARNINGRTKAAIEADPAWNQARDRSIARNKTTVGSTPTVQLALGKVDPTTGTFSTVGAPERPTAVRAIASSSVKFAFVRGGGATSRSAVASVDPGVCFSVGSFLASLNTNESALNGILGGIIHADLRVLSPGGIATVSGIEVPLLGIATELGVGTTDALVALPNLTVAKFITAMASVLNRQGNTLQANFLNAIAAKVPTATLKLADILSIAPGNNSALNLGVSVLELLGASLFVANGSNAIAIPDLGLNLGLLDVSAKATIVAPPKTACGGLGAKATSSQVSVDLTTAVGGIVSGLASATIHLGLKVASATGTLTSMRCGSGTQMDAIGVDVVTALVKDLNLHLDLKVLGGLLGNLVAVGVDVSAPSVGTASPSAVTLTYPAPPGLPAPQSVAGITSLNLANLSIALTLPLDPLGLLSALLGGILGAVVKPLLVALDPLLVGLLTPVLRLVGANLGGADVAAASRINCDAPRLLG